MKGFEVKAVKTGHINIQNAVVTLDKQELWLYNMDIPLYEKTSPILAPHYQAKGKRKLLLHKREIAKIAAALDKPGMVLLALEVIVSK
ncbi:MAG: SsrA-binding protein [bacterium]|nr:SsrA-binding protein [bacterium]